MFGFGPAELLILLAIILVIFGAGKLPDVFGSLGKGIREFRNAAEEPQPQTQVAPPVTSTETSATTSTPRS